LKVVDFGVSAEFLSATWWQGALLAWAAEGWQQPGLSKARCFQSISGKRCFCFV